MVLIFHAHIPGEPTHGFEPCVALCHRRSLAGPVDCCLRANVHFTALDGKARETAQQVVCVEQFEAGGTPRSKIELHGRHHFVTSGHGWAICLSSATSTLA